MNKLDIYICTKSKCTAKRVQVKLWAADSETGAYNGPALLTAMQDLVTKKQFGDRVAVHEVTCMSGCPVGPRVDMTIGARRVMYFQRKTPTGREDLIGWPFVESIESAVDWVIEKDEKITQ